MTGPPRLAVLHVQHTPARYPDALATLRAYLDRLWFCDPLLLIVDNSREGSWCTWMGDREAVIGGDNRDWEFSGWQRGVDALRRMGRDCDMYLLTNESFLAPGPSFLGEFPTFDQICGWHRDGRVAGRIDRYDASVTLCGRTIPSWVCTNAMFIPARAVARIGSLVSLHADDLARFLPDACPPGLTRRRTAYFPSARPSDEVAVTVPLREASGGLLAVEAGEQCEPRHVARDAGGPALGVFARRVRVGGRELEEALFRAGWHPEAGGAWSERQSTAAFAGPFADGRVDLVLARPPWAGWLHHRRDVVVRYTADPFLPDAPLSVTYRLRLLEWLTVRWRQRFPLEPATWATFRRKVRSILNEASLTGRLVDAGCPIADAAPMRYY